MSASRGTNSIVPSKPDMRYVLIWISTIPVPLVLLAWLLFYAN